MMMKSNNASNSRKVQAQIPGNAVSNMPLQTGTPGQPGNVVEICKIVQQLLQKDWSGIDGDPETAKQLRDMNSAAGTKYEELEQIADAIENPTLLEDPNTTIDNMCEEFLNKNNPLQKAAFNLQKIAKPKGRTSYEKEEDEKEEKARRGRKSNPFKFLMVQVQKLFDRGWPQSDIVKHIMKHHDFEQGIIKRAYDMIRKRATKKSKEASYSFNLKYVYAETQETLYDIENNLYKRSTRELLDRLYYLTECENYYSNKDSGTRNNYKIGNLSSVPSMLENVKDALKKRGMSEKDIEYYKNNIKEEKYYPFENVSIANPTDAEKGRNNA